MGDHPRRRRRRSRPMWAGGASARRGSPGPPVAMRPIGSFAGGQTGTHPQAAPRGRFSTGQERGAGAGLAVGNDRRSSQVTTIRRRFFRTRPTPLVMGLLALAAVAAVVV
jgi:hypothetical protein